MLSQQSVLQLLVALHQKQRSFLPCSPGLRRRPDSLQQQHFVSTGDRMRNLIVILNCICLGSIGFVRADDNIPRVEFHERNDVQSTPAVGSSAESQIRSRQLLRPLTSIRVAEALQNTSIRGEILKTPDDQSATFSGGRTVERHFTATPWHSRNTALCRFHYCRLPVYFQNSELEMCGNGCGCLTEFSSVTRMAAQISLLPVRMLSQPPCRPIQANTFCSTIQNCP